MNETNRTTIVLVAALWIVLMAVVIMLTWAADKDVVNRLRDFVQYLDDHRDNAGKLIVTLGALLLAVLALLVIILEVAPEDEEKELRVRQAGATTIVPAQALRMRLEEALAALPDVTGARARVSARDKGIATALDVTITPGANLASVTQEAVRIVADTVQTDLGLPVAGPPTVRVSFGGRKAEPVASSVSQPPVAEPEAAGLAGATAEAPPAEPPFVGPLEQAAPSSEPPPSAEPAKAEPPWGIATWQTPSPPAPEAPPEHEEAGEPRPDEPQTSESQADEPQAGERPQP